MANILPLVPNPLPLPIIGPQPNFVNLHNHIQGVVQEVVLLQNLPIPTIQQQFQQLHAQSNLIIGHLQQIGGVLQQFGVVLQQLTDGLNDVRDILSRQPQQLYNSTASMDAPLLYPQNVIIVPPLPATKKDLINLTAANCNATLIALGLDVPVAAIPIAARRQILMDYLGTGLRA